MEGNGRGNYLVFRRIAEMLQIRHNAPRNRKNGGEFPLLKMKEGSSRSLSGCLARGRFSLHAPSIEVIQPPVARDCTVKKTHFSKRKLSVAPIGLGVALVSAPAFAQDAPADEGATSTDDTIVVTGSILRRTNTEAPSPVTVLSSETLQERGIYGAIAVAGG